jgi:hypothetical protein
VVLCGLAGAVAYVTLAGPSANASNVNDGADHSAALKLKAETLLRAVATGNPKTVEDPLVDLAMLPDAAKYWFLDTFGTQAGPDLYGYWERQDFPNLPDLIKPFKTANESGRTEVRVTRIASRADLAACSMSVCRYQKDYVAKTLAAMQKPQALYFVSLATPGSKPDDYEEEVYFFAIVRGAFAYVGRLPRFM